MVRRVYAQIGSVGNSRSYETEARHGGRARRSEGGEEVTSSAPCT
jgi:hypothetical protein